MNDAQHHVTDTKVLDEIAQRVLWLSTRIVDAANRERATGDGVKVGGHQASSASMVSAMVALYFAHLDAPDKVSVKPHASPVLHGIQYLLGNLDRSYLTRLREFGGLQSYPSRTKDPDRVDFSTGSVGLGPAAPLFAAATRRYVDAHFGARPASRFVALLGDAELDEGNIWEAMADDATNGLGNVMWIVDFNRQSLDRVVPGIRIQQWRAQFAASGWHVVEVKYGPLLKAAFVECPELENWIDDMPNERYQSLFGLAPADLRARFLEGAPAAVTAYAQHMSDASLDAIGDRSRWTRHPVVVGGVRRVRRGGRPSERRFRLHREGLGAADGRQPPQPLGPDVRRADRCAPVGLGPDGGRRMGSAGSDISRPGSGPICGRRTWSGSCRRLRLPSRFRQPRTSGRASRSRRRRRSVESSSGSRGTRPWVGTW